MRGIRLSHAVPQRGIRLPQPHRSSSAFFHVHAHSMFSAGDALPSVEAMVATAVKHGHPALALTDHGNMAGSVRLYSACKKAGIRPFPGVEAYLVKDRQTPKKRFHVGMLALDASGYEALVRLSSHSHSRQSFHHKPLIDLADLAEWHERGWTNGIALTTGCYFGLAVQTLVNEGIEAAKHVVERFAVLVPHTFVELQNHNIDHGDGWSDAKVASALFEIATELGLPVVVAQDAHYCEPIDKPVHETLKRVVAFGPDPDDAVFPGDGFHLCDTDWARSHHESGHWAEAERGFEHLLDLHKLSIKELDHYSYNIPATVEDPAETLTRLCVDELRARNLPQPYGDRLGDELGVIIDTGMSGYLLLVKEVTDWCRDHDVFTQARGSASGSLVAWLLGITQVDPIKYKLRFERFMSRDRTKPPDIDLDVEKFRRDDLIDWLRSRFNICQIGTWAEYGITADGERAGRGSLIVAYKKMARARGVPDEELSSIVRITDIPEEPRAELLALSEYKPFKSYGVNAAGIVITTHKADLESIVPTMLVASSETVVTQFDKDDVEKMGLVKLDVLGLRTLSLLRRCVELLGYRDLSWIPLDDTRTFTACRNGATDGVFQLEGRTAQRGCREVKVRSLKDIIAIMALYRTAVMSSGGKDTYITRREGRERVPEMHPILHKALKETYGVPIFQEQVVDVLRDLGMSPDDLTDFLKTIKASQKAEIAVAQQKIAAAKQEVQRLAEQAGWSDQDMAIFWPAVEGFGEYGFNRAHATAYGLTAYRQAYLKTHHPLEFATALLATSEGTDDEEPYVRVVRGMGIRIGRPHVNVSGASYSMDAKRKIIRKGLVSIKGIGVGTAEEIAAHAPYASIQDIIDRCEPRTVNGGKTWAKKRTLNGHLAKLHDAGALEGLSDERERQV